MNNELSKQLALAEHSFRSGNIAFAEGLLNHILSKYPSNSKANELLGYIVGNRGDLDASIQLLKKATSTNHPSAEAWYHLGACLQNKGNSQDAVAAFQKSLGTGGDFFEGYHDLGLALANCERYPDAIEAFNKALILNPGSAEVFYNKARALDEIKRYEDALINYDRALASKPDFASAWYNRGITLYDLKRYGQALESFDKALALQPENTKAWNHRGVSLHDLKRYAEALLSYEKALAINPDNAEALSNRGVTLQALKRDDEALLSYDKALAIKPDLAEAHFNEGCLRLSNCDFVMGWEKHEWRWESKGCTSKKIETSIPLWKGENSNESLLVLAEQGIGDQILYCGMLRQLKQKAGHITVTLDPRLIPLFQRSFPEIAFLSKKSLTDTSAISKQIHMGSIGKYCRTKIEDFSSVANPYLKADAQKTNYLKAELQVSSKLICGISWMSKNVKTSEDKSLNLKELLPIISLGSLSFVDLQYGDTSVERENIKASSNVDVHHLDEIDNFNDLDGLAALVDACDIVVTTSNTTVHLAGALGKKTFLMIPYLRGKHWYWHEGHSQSLWYPSVKIFRQPTDGDWESVIKQIAAELDSPLWNKNGKD